MAEAFTGFPPSGVAFLAGLTAHNTRAYFDRNRGTYANDVAAPLRALVIAVGQRLLDRAGRDVCFDPTVGKSLLRINRDTRFSADKTPYNPWVDAIIELGRTAADARAAAQPRRRAPGELLLYVFGRQDAAHVEVTGPAAMVEAVRHARFDM